MEEILAKIKEATDRENRTNKCTMIGQLYEQICAMLDSLEADLNIAGRRVDHVPVDSELDRLELICDELIKILNTELIKVLKFLKPRFEAHMNRHPNITWEQVEKRLREAAPNKIWSLSEMERTGGEPDVIKIENGEVVFYDCSQESPTGRRNCVYDSEVEAELLINNPNRIVNGNAVDMAKAMGVELLDEKEYRELLAHGKHDIDTWTWIRTPVDKRSEGYVLLAHGDKDDNSVYIDLYPAGNHDGFGGFRSSIRI